MKYVGKIESTPINIQPFPSAARRTALEISKHYIITATKVGDILNSLMIGTHAVVFANEQDTYYDRGNLQYLRPSESHRTSRNVRVAQLQR